MTTYFLNSEVEINHADWSFINELHNFFEHTSLSDIFSIAPFLIIFIFIGSMPMLWALTKSYRLSKKQFEEANPHLTEKYFSFWKWLDVINDDGSISNKNYKKRFGQKSFTNTDTFLYSIRQSIKKIKNHHKKISLPIKIAMICLAAFIFMGIIFT